MKYKVQKLSESVKMKHPFGFVNEFFSGTDLSELGVAKIRMTDDNLHYHKKLTEIYYILSGQGKIMLDGEIFSIGPDTAVLIRPGVKHRATANKGQKFDLLVFTIPSYSEDDEFHVKEKP